MAGVYFLLAQLIMIYGQKFAILGPMTYSYVVISCDLLSLLIQATSGGIDSHSLAMYESSVNGTHVMVAGLAFQVLSMTAFKVLFGHFCWKIKYYLRQAGHKEIEQELNPDYRHIRASSLFKYLPLMIFVGVLFVYIRSVYRVMELSEGWKGYLITHEPYFMALDALIMALACLIFILFHPGVAIGPGSDTESKEMSKEMSTGDASICDSTV